MNSNIRMLVRDFEIVNATSVKNMYPCCAIRAEVVRKGKTLKKVFEYRVDSYFDGKDKDGDKLICIHSVEWDYSADKRSRKSNYKGTGKAYVKEKEICSLVESGLIKGSHFINLVQNKLQQGEY